MGRWTAALLATTVLCGVQAATATTTATGSAAGIAVGPYSSDPSSITDVNGTAFFTAYTPETGRDLWKSDGTAEGTMLVKDIAPADPSRIPHYLTVVGDMLLFYTQFENENFEQVCTLWSSDGTEAGTVPIKQGVCVQGIISLGDVAYIAAFAAFSESSSGAYDLWKTDGTEAGTLLVKPEFFLCTPLSFFITPLNGQVLYRGCDHRGEELWITDDTEAGAHLVKDIYPGLDGSRPGGFKSVDDTVFFIAREPSTHSELWKTDGTTEDTQIVKDIRPGALFSSCAGASGLARLGNEIFFSANNGATGCELWKSDGSEAGTVPVSAIVPGTNSNDEQGVRVLREMDGMLFFRAVNSLWKSDGTAEGTILLRDVFALNPVASGGNLFFQSFEQNLLWRSDGTEAGTLVVKEFTPSFFGVQSLTDVGGVLFFTADSDVIGNELWRSDGTEAGTRLVRDIVPQDQPASPTPSDTDTPAPPSLTPASTDTPPPNPTETPPIATETPVPTSTPTATATHSPTSPPTASPTSTATPTPGLAGDVDCDGRASAADIVALVQLQSIGTSGCNPEAGDLTVTLSALFEG